MNNRRTFLQVTVSLPILTLLPIVRADDTEEPPDQAAIKKWCKAIEAQMVAEPERFGHVLPAATFIRVQLIRTMHKAEKPITEDWPGWETVLYAIADCLVYGNAFLEINGRGGILRHSWRSIDIRQDEMTKGIAYFRAKKQLEKLIHLRLQEREEPGWGEPILQYWDQDKMDHQLTKQQMVQTFQECKASQRFIEFLESLDVKR